MHPGDSFGDYILIRQIAAGGMGEIFLAKRRGPAGFEKTCVIKRILPHLGRDPKFLEMFLNEARIAASLDHRNIITIFELGQMDQTWFITMEYVRGIDLRKLINRQNKAGSTIPVEHALEIVTSILGGLDYAHRKRRDDGELLGIVHRDISPSNILISYEGEIKICDFGIARVVTLRHETTEGLMKGKLPYMSPEQVLGNEVDLRSDIYSLGLVFFEILTGTHPYGEIRSIGHVMDIISGETLPGPRTVNAGIPEELDNIVRRAMSRLPVERYTNAAEMKAAIDTFVTAGPFSPTGTALAKHIQILFHEEIALERRAVDETRVLEKSTTFSDPIKQTSLPPEKNPFRSLMGFFGIAITCILLGLFAYGRIRTEPGGFGIRGTVVEPEVQVDETGSKEVPSPSPKEAGKPAAFESPAPVTMALRIISTPTGAEVTVDGRPTGLLTPARLTGLEVGKMFKLLLQKNGYHDLSRTLVPDESLGERLVVDLVPLPGALSIVSIPPGAEVFLDDRRTGRKTPCRIGDLDVDKPLTIRLQMAGHRDWSDVLSFEPGENADLTPILEKLFGSLRIDSTPWTEVSIDGIPLGKTPLVEAEYPVGSHRLVLENQDASIREEIAIEISEKEIYAEHFTFRGSLEIRTDPVSEVYIDGNHVGRTPLSDMEVIAGPHLVRLVDEGTNREKRFTVQVASGSVTKVDEAF